MAAGPCIFCNQTHDFTQEESFQVLRKTPDSLRLLLDDVNREAISVKPSEKWSPREILIHLIDTEYAYGFRFRFIMGEKKPKISPYDQEEWSKTFTYGDLDATQLIRAFTPIRRVNLELLQTVAPDLFDKKADHPEYGLINVAMMIPHLAAHDLKHLQQIRDRLPVA